MQKENTNTTKPTKPTKPKLIEWFAYEIIAMPPSYPQSHIEDMPCSICGKTGCKHLYLVEQDKNLINLVKGEKKPLPMHHKPIFFEPKFPDFTLPKFFELSVWMKPVEDTTPAVVIFLIKN